VYFSYAVEVKGPSVSKFFLYATELQTTNQAGYEKKKNATRCNKLCHFTCRQCPMEFALYLFFLCPSLRLHLSISMILPHLSITQILKRNSDKIAKVSKSSLALWYIVLLATCWNFGNKEMHIFFKK
jgi:hypothetical protein